jgi:prepilin-type N-terminal cleavage/methylation domain-containing protein
MIGHDQNARSVKWDGYQPAGFTLIEVTLALGVAAICLITLMGLLPTALKTQHSSIQQTTANQIVSQISSFLRADVRLPPGQASRACPNPPDPDEPCDWSNLNGHWRNVAAPDIMYFTNEAKPTGTVTEPNNVPANAAFRAKITYMTPPTQTTSLASIRVTWPAVTDPDTATPAGSVTSVLAVNR